MSQAVLPQGRLAHKRSTRTEQVPTGALPHCLVPIRVDNVRMTEQQPYNVVRHYPGFELREYPAHLVAEVTVDAGFEDAGGRAFNALLQYISGANRANTKMAMTAPVVQSQKLAMTAPVVQSPTAAGGYTVAFVLPANVPADQAPIPTNSTVTVRQVPAALSAAVRFSGRWSEALYEGHVNELRVAIQEAGLQAISHPRFARYDPPFKPWFLRRNEVLIDVSAA